MHSLRLRHLISLIFFNHLRWDLRVIAWQMCRRFRVVPPRWCHLQAIVRLASACRAATVPLYDTALSSLGQAR